MLPLRSPLLACLLFAACGDTSSGTDGQRISLGAEVSSDLESGRTFRTSLGWDVSLQRVLLSIGGFTYFDGATILSSAPASVQKARVPYLGSGVAFAHPGHYVPGEARGELLVASSVDLLAGPIFLGSTSGVTGVVRSATFRFASPAVGAFSSELGTHVLRVEGLATRENESRTFVANLEPNEVLDGKALPEVEGCPFTEVTIRGDGVVALRVRIAKWFDQVEFETLPKGEAVEMPGDTLARKELARGVKVGDAYAFSYRSN